MLASTIFIYKPHVSFLQMNVPVVSKEFILTGVLRQKLEPEVFAMSELRELKTTAKARGNQEQSAERRKSRSSNVHQKQSAEPKIEPVDARRRSSTPKPNVSTRTRRNIKTPAKYKDDLV